MGREDSKAAIGRLLPGWQLVAPLARAVMRSPPALVTDLQRPFVAACRCQCPPTMARYATWRGAPTRTEEDAVRGLEDKSIVVTGAAQGLGEGMVRRLASEGARVVIADLNGDKANALAGELRSKGYRAIGVKVDVGERSQVKAMIELTVSSFGGIDVLFNNAGFNKPVPFFDVDEANFNAIIRVNTLGVLICTQEAGKQMIEQGHGGKIINTASIAGRQGYAEFAPYCVSKAGVISLTQAAAREMAKHKITVNGIAPGVVRTPLWDGLEQDMIDRGVIKEKGEFIESFSAGILVGRPSLPDDLSGLCAFLASSDSDYITGQIIMCDGGMVLV
jgi:meso-butanediol dehydrogenase/(S,S)-butanediol dehydrogenase/diacetyl reductase